LTSDWSVQYVGCMSRLMIELPSQSEQTEFNLQRWDELLIDPVLARIEGRIETDRHGQIIMSPPPSARHGSYQFKVADALRDALSTGEFLTECPISTADGVRAADVAWASDERMRELGNRSCFSRSPEICIEVLSPRNSKREIEEKKALYFDAGAREVWVCDDAGKMTFYLDAESVAAQASRMCPKFPKRIERR
jgi:Uma2 family endonuclease